MLDRARWSAIYSRQLNRACLKEIRTKVSEFSLQIARFDRPKLDS